MTVFVLFFFLRSQVISTVQVKVWDVFQSGRIGTLKQGYPLLPYEDAVPTRLSLVAW
jgi:hypothetical protein